ncbi:Zinc/iron permease [Anaeromyces robustus]|uniref:Zinc/iron permease n=1 Tax=Anaeromyces robustus TaxID=1754192 RepID=A0A1Y1XQF3_9FUNG|nr:Zinc/iron permease [Anaeromyces robustus]|eukprot:ORX87746.1 Zinc/iron permease [Anaeromyces robustus]
MSKVSNLFVFIAIILLNITITIAQNEQPTEHGSEHNPHHLKTKKRFDIQKLFIKYLPKNPMVAAFSSVIYITMIPLILLKFLPTDLPKSMLNTLLAFALGTVLGDVFLHMIPELMAREEEIVLNNEKIKLENNQHYSKHLIDIGVLILSGILIFYVLEKIVEKQQHNNHKHNHAKHHHNLENKQEYADKVFSSKNDDQYFAIMQVLASMTHGFTDGLSVTFAFISSPSSGLTTAFAMFLHEIPHKFGDYTIMRQLGFSSKRAITMQFITALGTMIGSVVASIIFWMSSSSSSISINELCDNYIMPITTGSLIYLALVGMLPELINYKPKGVIKSLVQIILEVISFSMGAFIMRWIALNES